MLFRPQIFVPLSNSDAADRDRQCGRPTDLATDADGRLSHAMPSVHALLSTDKSGKDLP